MSTTVLAGCGGGRTRAAGPVVAPPNLLLVILDDLGRGEVGVYGQQVLQTPVLDDLAAGGVRFDQAYATPTCAPTRCSLFTGLHAGHARIKRNADAGGGLLLEDVTLPEVLRDAGYKTGLVGKWGLGPDRRRSDSHPNSQGFDHFFGYLNQGQAQDYWPTYLWRNDERVKLPENADADATYAPDLFTEEALGFLDGVVPGQRFFLTLALTTPHAPNEIPSDAPYSDQPWPEGERNHAAQVTALDTQIGTVLAGLAERGLDHDTLVLVVSDNGPHSTGSNYGRVGSTLPHEGEFFDGNGPLRGEKREVYEGGIRVPMIASLPASMRDSGTAVPPGTVVDVPLAVWDIFSTFAELAGVAAPTAGDGISFAPALRGEVQPEHDHLYWQYSGLEGAFDEAVRFGSWKAVRHQGSPTELYQLVEDLGETRDLASVFPSVVQQAEALMAQSVA